MIRGNARGFTLLETVAALAIFAFAVTVLSTVYVAGIDARGATVANRGRQAATRFVRDTVVALPTRAEVEAGGTEPLPGGPAVRWQARVMPLEFTGLYAVEVAIEHGDGRPPPAEPERLELFRPAWARPAETQVWSRESAKRWKKPEERAK